MDSTDQSKIRHIFIVNPGAGQAIRNKNFLEKLRKFAENRTESIDIYVTAGKGDAEVIVRTICEEHMRNERKPSYSHGLKVQCTDGSVINRFYACGGDGTLNEVVNGAYGFSDIEIACIPIGTGNDFVRNFDIDKEVFLDFNSQLEGLARSVDLIRYIEKKEAGEQVRYCINMFNIGFDCNVVDITAELKKKPLLKGSLAYLVGVGLILIKKKGASLDILLDDGTEKCGDLLLTAVANGCYCGGGVKGIPLADVSDGFMDVSIVSDIPRTTFMKLFPKYAKGTHLDESGIEKILTYKKCRSLTIRPLAGSMRLCTDGEITDSGEVRFEIVPGAMKFSVPAKRV